VLKHIERLVKKEHEPYGQGKLSDGARQRLRTLEVELDQCWDASGASDASSEAIRMRRAFGRRKLSRTTSSDEAPRTRVGYRSQAAELGVPFHEAGVVRARGRGVGRDLRMGNPVRRVASRRAAVETC
jgi:uncharacterized protein DUF2630